MTAETGRNMYVYCIVMQELYLDKMLKLWLSITIYKKEFLQIDLLAHLPRVTIKHEQNYTCSLGLPFFTHDITLTKSEYNLRFLVLTLIELTQPY